MQKDCEIVANFQICFNTKKNSLQSCLVAYHTLVDTHLETTANYINQESYHAMEHTCK